MNFSEAIAYIESTGKFAMNLGLERIKRLCELLGNPQDYLKVIHVGGTNGKGSTVTFISSMLKCQGYKVGIYTSPYLERFTERIKINDKEIGEDEVADLVEKIKPLVERIIEEGYERPTEFEIITTCAFKYFKDKNVDFVVLEVGLGGRFDATNVVNPILSVITSISYDHMNVLGDTLSKIAFEKAGIIKEGRPVVIYPQDKEALSVLLDVALNRNSRIFMVDDMKHDIKSNTIDGIIFDVYWWKNYKDIKIRMLGTHQVMNAITALYTIEVLRMQGYEIENSSIYKGLEEAKWPGRFEVISKSPYIVLDGGHNIQGIESLTETLKYYFKGKRIVAVCGMLRDKEYTKMLEKLFEVCNSFITTEPDSPRALSAAELEDIIKGLGKEAISSKSIEDAVEKGLSSVKNDEVLLFCGSLYMIGRVRSILKQKIL
ncbi:bifunctional folylpolyglutamate synthase/dihydrofolate synthase [Caloramator sp. E03]|uniref:bifunctional folylpolyglutamate synthase/dihydrofolate synthase n=1 Tax=Caloramator sp. E03 TaxID=2576307 RepID=UPI001110F29F|nr:folylpolyglutamate synthase/dihydrofolate synthase family protein [Caloramator sp. E03]QCX32965.1 bifunctional folylpolyglutamate synthase/dihydrofolate synthase [Caloramator sp. E03]